MPTIQDLRAKIPELNGLDDSHAIEYIQSVHYPNRSKEEIAQRLGVQTEKQTSEVPTRNAFAYANDFAIDAGNAAVGLVKSGVDLFAPDSQASASMADFIKSGQDKQSDSKKFKRAQLQESLQAADGEISKAGAYLKHAVVDDPLGTVAEAAGNFGPFAVMGRGMQIARMSDAARVAAGGGAAGALSAGEVRGNIWQKINETPDEVLQQQSPEYAQLRASGATEQQAKQAVGADVLRNLPELATTAVVGALSGKYGVEAMAAGVAPKIAANRLAAAGLGFAQEGSEGAVEQLASNVGVQRAIPSQSLGEGVALNAAAEGIVGAPAGLVAGGHQAVAHPADAIRATKLQETGPLTKGVNAAVEVEAQAVESAVAEAATQTRHQQTAQIVEQLRLLPPAQQEEALGLMSVADNMQAPGPVRRRAQNRLDYLFSSVAPQGATPAAQTTETVPQDAVAPVAPTVEVPNEPAAQPAEQSDAIAQREADRPAPAVTPRQDGDILTNSGVPFRNMTAAMRALGRAGEGYELAPVEGGLVVRKSAAPQPEQMQHAPAEESVPPVVDAAQASVQAEGTPVDAALPGQQPVAADEKPADVDITAPTNQKENSNDYAPSHGEQKQEPDLPNVEGDEKSLQSPERRGVQELRSQGGDGLLSMGEQLRDVSSGRGREAVTEPHTGPTGKQQRVRAGQRTLGDEAGAGPESGKQRGADLPGADTGGGGLGGRVGDSPIDPGEPDESRAPNRTGADISAETVRTTASPIVDVPREVASRSGVGKGTRNVGGGDREALASGVVSGSSAGASSSLNEKWKAAVARGDTEAAPADDTNQTSGTRAEAQAAADQAPAPERSDAAAPASVPAAGGAAATEAAGVTDAEGWDEKVRAVAAKRASLPERIPMTGLKVIKKDSTVLGFEGYSWYVTNEAGATISTGYTSKAAAQRQAGSMTTENPAWTAAGRELDRLLESKPGAPKSLTTTAQAATPKKRSVPAAKAAAAREAKRADYFTPGNVVKGYGGLDRVISYSPPDESGQWGVKVQRVVKRGDSYVVAKEGGRDAEVRQHATEPGERDLKAGPVERAVGTTGRVEADAPVGSEAEAKPVETATETPQTKKNAAAEQTPASEAVPAEGNAQAPKPTSKIEDFGEKLAGARKDYAALLKDALDVDVSAEPLSKSWPEPDYQKLLDGGADPFVVAWIHASRDEVPTKPQATWKLRGWVDSVKLLRSVSQQLLTGEISKDAMAAKLDAPEFSKLKSAVGGRAELYQLVGHDKSLKGITLQKHHYTLYRGEQNVTKWAIEQKAKATAFSNWPREIAVADTKQEVLDEFKSKIDSLDLGKKAKGQASQFVIYRKRGQDGTWIGKKIGREYIDLHKADDVKAAREYLAANAEALEDKLTKYRETPFERKVENQPRVGDDHRNGAPVTPEVFADTFGFRGVQFGNYVEQGRRQSDLNEAFDGLMDMAAVLGIPPRALSLNGQLGLAFGARGKGGKNAPAAHFEPGNVIINLTKGGGPGSLAHEWWHGLDNYFARRSGDNSGYVTGGAKTDAMRDELRAAFNSVQRATQVPTLRRRAAELDKRRSKPYWNTPIELSARAFESYVIAKLKDQNAANDYLANVVDEKVWNIDEAARAEFFGGEKVETYPYPGQAELPAVRAAFDEFFKIVETIRDDAGNVAMLSRSANYNDAVDAVLDGSKPESDSVRLSGSLDVLEALGLPSLPLATTGDRLAKMHYDHGLTRSDLKALPELLANPVMVFDSATKPGSKVLVLDLWRRGMPVIAAVHPNVQLKRVDVNLLASAYPKDRPEQLGVWYREKLLRYADKDKARAWATNGGVQFPWLVQLQRGLESSVLGPKDIGKSALSRSDQRDLPEASQRASEIEKLVSQIVSRWNGSPEVIVVDSLSDPRVPERIRAEDARQQSQGATGAPEGMFYAGKVYLVASELHGDADVVRVLFHEALGHAGLRGTFGKEMGALLDRLAVLNQGKVRAKARQYGLDYDKPSDRRAAAEEVLAEMAQTRPEIGWVKRAIATIRSFLREHIPGFSRMRYSDADLIGQFILPARRFVEQGQPKEAPDEVQSGMAAAMLSRSPSEVLRSINQESIRNAFLDATTGHDNVSLWAKTVGTQYDKAQRHPQTFGRVFNAVQDYIKDISSFANAAADQAPHILPKLDKLSDLKPERLKASGDRNATKADLNAVGAVIFQGTLDKQLLDRPALLAKGLTEKQADLYEEFRAAVNQSLEDMAKTEIVRLAGTAGATLASQALAAPTAREAADIMADHLRQQGLSDDADGLYGKVDAVEKLKAEGYAPLMRFGKHTVHIQRGGETLFFGMYESRIEANAMARKLRGDAEFAGLPVEQGVMSQEAYKLFNGLSIDSLELFANEVGGQDNPVYQDFLKLTKNNRSALKRLIHRNGTAGFSTNTERVLASFVTSNARLASGNLHLGRAKAAANDIPKELGDLKDEAVKLVEWVQNPTETAQALRGLLFTTFIGGSVASALVNMTQPMTMTLPYLSQYGGLAKAGARMLAALKIVASGKATGELGQALRRAEADGIVSPQEIHHLQAATTDSLGNNPYLRRAAFIWGAMFSLAEQFNRRLSFAAAYQTALDSQVADPFAFAEKAVVETQGLYNKGNGANWTRNVAGATALTFKQFSTHYIEWITRMYQSGPEGKKAAITALAILMLAGGAGGLPFADDVDDLIDTLAQALGYDFNSKRAKRKFIADALEPVLGKNGSEVAAEIGTRGLTAMPGFPMDLSLRMGMGNLLPATGILLRSNTDTGRQVLEVAGAAGSLANMALEGGKKMLQGEPVGAVKEVVPVAIQNVAKALEMWNTGEYRNQKGAKVMDVDAVDGSMKFVGFQPAEVARESAEVNAIQRTIQLAKNVESDLGGRMAQARVDGDLEAEQAAREELIAWNRKNPETPIRIRPQDIVRRVRELKSSRADRLVKSAPKELRGAVREAVN